MAIVDAKHTQTIEELVSKLGEGGADSSPIKLVTITAKYGATTTYSSDTTFKEMKEASENGKLLIGRFMNTYMFGFQTVDGFFRFPYTTLSIWQDGSKARIGDCSFDIDSNNEITNPCKSITFAKMEE